MILEIFQYECDFYSKCDVDKMQALGGSNCDDPQSCSCFEAILLANDPQFNLLQSCSLPNGGTLMESVALCDLSTHTAICKNIIITRPWTNGGKL